MLGRTAHICMLWFLPNLTKKKEIAALELEITRITLDHEAAHKTQTAMEADVVSLLNFM